MAQPKPQGDEQQAGKSSSSSSEQQEQQQPPEPPGGQGDYQQLEGPNGLLAEWRFESSAWWSKVFRLVVGECCAALS
jgi:hypothetical protein